MSIIRNRTWILQFLIAQIFTSSSNFAVQVRSFLQMAANLSSWQTRLNPFAWTILDSGRVFNGSALSPIIRLQWQRSLWLEKGRFRIPFIVKRNKMVSGKNLDHFQTIMINELPPSSAVCPPVGNYTHWPVFRTVIKLIMIT